MSRGSILVFERMVVIVVAPRDTKLLLLLDHLWTTGEAASWLLGATTGLRDLVIL